MKKWYLYFWLIIATFGMAGCDEESYLENHEEWNGEGLPTWINDWGFLHDLKMEWGTDSYLFGVLWKLYKFEHNDKLLLAMSYEKVGYEYDWEENTLCYDAYGREVNFSKVRESFRKNVALIYTNEICLENSVPQLPNDYFENPQSSGWFQEAINESCREVREAGNFMLTFHFGQLIDEAGNSYPNIEYDYADRTEKKRTTVSKIYTISGEKMNNVSKAYFKREIRVWSEYISQWYTEK